MTIKMGKFKKMIEKNFLKKVMFIIWMKTNLKVFKGHLEIFYLLKNAYKMIIYLIIQDK